MIVVERIVLSGLDVEADETVCGLVGVLNISVVGTTDEVENGGNSVDKEV